jgi:N-acetylglucosaminyl-diphospho-decaprenol L-rhamnosyltransferase
MTQLLTIVLNWRTPEMTLRATQCALTALNGINGALLIIDNNSGDGSFETIRASVSASGWDRGPHRVTVLQSGHNGGFGAGNNFGIRTGLPDGGQPDYIYILNSDAFPEPGAISALLLHLERHPADGIAGSQIHDLQGQVSRTAFRFPSIIGDFEANIRFGPVSRLLHNHIVAPPVPETTCHTDWVSGASLMFRRTMLDEIGLFDETFFLYFEETELCHRAARAGWRCAYVADSRVMHIGSATTGLKRIDRIPQFWLDSRLHYFNKIHGPAYAVLATLATVAGGILWRARLLVQRKEPGDAPLFLTDLSIHALRYAFRATLRRLRGLLADKSTCGCSAAILSPL